VNRRTFMASIAAAFAVGKVELLTKPPPLVLTTGWFTVGPTGRYRTLGAALEAAGAGGIVYLEAGHYEMTGPLMSFTAYKSANDTPPQYDPCDCESCRSEDA
jgi:hypothetical protein